MNTHPTEYLPAFVLGALDAETMRLVETHLHCCPQCRQEADTFRQHVSDAGRIAPVPAHIKHQLMLRVRASSHQPHHTGATQTFVPVAAARQMLMIVATSAVVLALLFGFLMLDARRQLGAAQQALQSSQQASGSPTDQQIAAFLSNPNTVSQELRGPHIGVTGRMYMQAGHNRAVLMIAGLPRSSAGTTYQFWFATATVQVPSATFQVDAAGTAQALFDAPQPVDSYGEVMVTVEPTGGSTVPSNKIVLAAKLSTATIAVWQRL